MEEDILGLQKLYSLQRDDRTGQKSGTLWEKALTKHIQDVCPVSHSVIE